MFDQTNGHNEFLFLLLSFFNIYCLSGLLSAFFTVLKNYPFSFEALVPSTMFELQNTGKTQKKVRGCDKYGGSYVFAPYVLNFFFFTILLFCYYGTP